MVRRIPFEAQTPAAATRMTSLQSAPSSLSSWCSPPPLSCSATSDGESWRAVHVACAVNGIVAACASPGDNVAEQVKLHFRFLVNDNSSNHERAVFAVLPRLALLMLCVDAAMPSFSGLAQDLVNQLRLKFPRLEPGLLLLLLKAGTDAQWRDAAAAPSCLEAGPWKEAVKLLTPDKAAFVIERFQTLFPEPVRAVARFFNRVRSCATKQDLQTLAADWRGGVSYPFNSALTMTLDVEGSNQMSSKAKPWRIKLSLSDGSEAFVLVKNDEENKGAGGSSSANSSMNDVAATGVLGLLASSHFPAFPCNRVLPLTAEAGASAAASGCIIELVPGFLDSVAGQCGALHNKVDKFVEGLSAYERMNTFLPSMRVYVALSLLFGLRDRHRDNLLLTRCGCLCNVDFGWALGARAWFVGACVCVCTCVLAFLRYFRTLAHPAACFAPSHRFLRCRCVGKSASALCCCWPPAQLASGLARRRYDLGWRNGPGVRFDRPMRRAVAVAAGQKGSKEFSRNFLTDAVSLTDQLRRDLGPALVLAMPAQMFVFLFVNGVRVRFLNSSAPGRLANIVVRNHFAG